MHMRRASPLVLAPLLLAAPAAASTYHLEEVRQALGVTDAELAKLKAAGVTTTADLYAHAADAAREKALLKSTGVAKKKLRAWRDACDLMRISGVGPDVAGLLAAVGVGTTRELARADAAKLSAKIEATNAKRKLTENTPSAEHLAAWIRDAAQLR